MESKNRRNKRLCVNVSQEAWTRLQDHSLKVVDRHAMNVAGDIMERELMKLELPEESEATEL